MTNSCGHPKDMLADPPGASDEQKYCNLYHYTIYLRVVIECPKDDCKCMDNGWNNYTLAYGTICYPPET